MSDESAGEKTEQASAKKLADAFAQGQFAKSAEIQTLVVTTAAATTLFASAKGMWNQMQETTEGIFHGLHTIEVIPGMMSTYAATAASSFSQLVTPTLGAATGGALLAGAMQTRFRFTPKAAELKWSKINPVNGWKRIASPNSWATTGFSVFKFASLGGVLYQEIHHAIRSPVFYSSVGIQEYITFLGTTTVSILVKAIGVMVLLAAADYAYQVWKTKKDLMMTKQEVSEESKSAEGDPKMKGRRKQMHMAMRQRKMLSDVPLADVIITNPTHLAVALRYDKKSMVAPKILAMGADHIAARIRQIATDNQVPIIENKPIARMLYKHAAVGSEIPAALYAAVAEILATVYRLNPYRYYRAQAN